MKLGMFLLATLGSALTGCMVSTFAIIYTSMVHGYAFPPVCAPMMSAEISSALYVGALLFAAIGWMKAIDGLFATKRPFLITEVILVRDERLY